MPICVGVIASGYAIVGMMLYEMEFGTGFGFGVTILTLHVLTTWGIIKLPGILLGILVGIGISIPGQPQATHYAMIGGLVVVGSLLVFLVKKVLGVRSDLKLLARLRGRYHGLLESCCDIPQLQAAASLVYGEILQVGGELPEEPDGRT